MSWLGENPPGWCGNLSIPLFQELSQHRSISSLAALNPTAPQVGRQCGDPTGGLRSWVVAASSFMVGGLSDAVPWDASSAFATPQPRQDPSSCCCLLSPVVSILKTVTSIAQRKQHPILYKWLRASALGKEAARLSNGWGNQNWF